MDTRNRKVTEPTVLELLHDIRSRLEKIETDNEKFLNSVLNTNKRVDKIESSVNQLEQHSRNCSIRLFNLTLSNEDAKSALKTSKAVYKVLSPILQCAVEDGELDEVPSIFRLIEYAHTLPTKGDGPCPIIVRFQSRIYRSLIFSFKKDYFKRNPSCKVSIFEDLTTSNFKLLKSLQQDDRVLAAWTAGGRCKYRLKSAPDSVKSADSPLV